MNAPTREIGGLEFWLVGQAVIQRTNDGRLAEYSFALPEGQRVNPYSEGPFCRFGLAAAPRAPGVYAVLVEGQLKYLGRCEDLWARFGSRGYGSISARNLHNDGQGTNCKLNGKILQIARAGGTTEVWFHGTDDFVSIEAKLISELEPEWNGRAPGNAGIPATSSTVSRRPADRRGDAQGGSTTTGPRDFSGDLERLLSEASSKGLESMEVNAGQLHRIVGGYPGSTHQMPICCSRMRSAMRPGDEVVRAPPKGNGASVTIKYLLPR